MNRTARRYPALCVVGRGIRPLARLAAAALLIAATGCANLEAVRDFTATSKDLTGYRDITDRYLTTAERRLAEIPDDPTLSKERELIVQNGQAIAEQKASLYALHAVSTSYMSTLSQLAGANTYKVSTEIDGVAGAIRAIPELDIAPKHVNAVASLLKKMTGWALAAKQSRDVKAMVQENGPEMDTVLEAMENVLRNHERVLKTEHAEIVTFNRARLFSWREATAAERAEPATRRRALLVMALAQRSSQALQVEHKRVETSVAAARKGVTAVRQGHRTMLDNVDKLSTDQMKALLEKAYADLQAARAEIQIL